MKTVKMKNGNGDLYPRIPESDVSYHLKNGWSLVDNNTQDKPETKKKSMKPKVEEPTVEVDLDLDLTEENE
jgi:hypothetical protein